MGQRNGGRIVRQLTTKREVVDASTFVFRAASS